MLDTPLMLWELSVTEQRYRAVLEVLAGVPVTETALDWCRLPSSQPDPDHNRRKTFLGRVNDQARLGTLGHRLGIV